MSTIVKRRKSVESTMPERVSAYPMIRYMGSKFRLLPLIYSVLESS